ncbi:hypothetical protein [Legionella cardiaca]|uniref:Macro domain-containing protein n=1 Tax=Legionella cardiaca TaxID=1071983 RepID=A0ABY8AU38_9GAMM|nr:hypothetical protein [Legionella cardiaca]WED43030.1 hypothetical protein PXX05_14195 [Legionella cardiaca]
MTVKTQPANLTPQDNSLIVCAGSVTCDNVSNMGSGFNVFKKYFNKNKHESGDKGWQEAYNELLKKYYSVTDNMPAYIRIAQQDGYIGGIATVPVYTSFRGLTFKEKFSEEDLHAQYQQAIKGAVNDAKSLKRPLYLQPLGIGVYGWNPELAAELFAKAIIASDPNDEVEIIIPIYDQTANSNDKRFERALKKELAKQRELDLSELDVGTPKASLPERENEESLSAETLSAPTTEAIPLLDPRQSKLNTIVNTLIKNIEEAQGNRRTSGKNSFKVTNLRTLSDEIIQTSANDWSSPVEQRFIEQIMTVCQTKRNPWHFWATPASVKEFAMLLEREGLTVARDNLAALK